jgi:uncharacterized RDD family membrane protein YckC
MKSNALVIRTPEGIVFAQSLAGPVTRFFAWVIDLMLMIAFLYVLNQLMNWVRLISPDIATSVNTAGFFVINVGYGMVMEWVWRGQTIGKRVMGLRVVDAEGLKLQFDQIVTRNLLRFLDMLPLLYVVGGVSCWLSRKCQRLGDIAANTIVIRIPQIAEPDLEQLLEGKFNSLRRYPHLAARLRQRISPVEAATALQAVIRRDRFDPIARIELFRELAARFQAKVEFPPDATEGLTDEQCIRNVIDVIYSARA